MNDANHEPDEASDRGDETETGSTDRNSGDKAATDSVDVDVTPDSEDDAEGGLPSPGDLQGNDSGSGEDAGAAEAVDDDLPDIEELDADVEETEGPPSLPEKPDDVRGSRETPEEKLDFRSGDTVGGRFTVERYLGSSGGGTSYLCREDENGSPVVIKVLAMPPPEGERLERIREMIRTASQIRTETLTDILGMGTTEGGEVFVAMEYIEGESLSRAVSDQREAGREITVAEMFHVVSQICDGLEVIHRNLTHGILTPFNIYISKAGQLKIQNLGFGQISARYLHGHGEGPFHESIYVAPEVTRDPANLTARADIYSTGMIAAELLSGGGLPRERGHARDVALRIANQYGEPIYRLIGASLANDPRKRTASADEFRVALESAVRDYGVDPKGGLPQEGLDIQPAVEVRDDDDDELFDIPGPEESKESVVDESEERYLVRKDGLDYGPFTKEEVLEQLYDDEIDEHTSVLDRATQDRSPLGEQEAFVEEVEEYIPIREERKRKERERREEIQRKVKQGGKAVLVVSIIAGVLVLAGLSYYYFVVRPEPEELPMEKAFVSLGEQADYKFLPPPEDFETVAANEDVLQQIFDPNADPTEIQERVRQARGGGSGGGGGGAGSGSESGSGASTGGGGSGGGGDDDVTTVDMSNSGESKEHLSDKKINDIILSNFSALRGCIQKELDDNPSFSGVTVKFYIRPNGTTGGVTLREKQYLDKPVGRCLVREFRQMKFPAHSAINKRGVTFPLEVQ